MKKAVIFSARGIRSFTSDQVQKLQAAMNVRFVRCLNPMPENEFIRLAAPYEIIGLTRRTLKDVSRPVLDRLPLLRGLAVYATGYEWIDVRHAARRGIRFFNLPDYSAQTVAEHAWACLLALSRRITLSFDKTRRRVPADTSLRGWEIHGRTLGIIGYGRIGKRVGRLGRAFGVRVIWTDRRAQGLPGRRGMKALLEQSDMLVLSCSYERGRRPLLARREFGRMKQGSILVNVGRPGLVDHSALIDSIRSGRIAGYALDDDLPCLKKTGLEHGRILETAHTGWYSNEAMARGTNSWVGNLVALARGRKGNVT